MPARRSIPASVRPRHLAVFAALLLSLAPGGRVVHAGSGPSAPVQTSPGCSSVAAENALPETGLALVTINFTNQVQAAPLIVDVASTGVEQARGLMCIASLPQDQGELFDFQDAYGGREIQEGFWMEDTLIPLSVAFIGEDHTVHQIIDMQAEDLTTHTPDAPYLYAVEANQGWFADNDILPGSSVDLANATAQAEGRPAH